MNIYLKSLIVVCIIAICCQQNTVLGQTEKTYVRSFNDLNSGKNNCSGFISFKAKFTGFAGRLNIFKTKLYITKADAQLKKSIENHSIEFKYYNEIDANAYLIPRFDLYATGYATVGTEAYGKIASAKPFKVQVSPTLGDFTTPDFGEVQLNSFKGVNSWENSGDIALEKPAPFTVTEIGFRDLNIRVKQPVGL